MNVYLDWLGRAAAIVGVLLCIAAVLIRLLGNYLVAGIEVADIFMVGTSGMVFACLARLYARSAD